MICRNCGATIQKTDAVCPFCGAMNAEGAERKFMGRLYRMKDDLRQSATMPEMTAKQTAFRSFGILGICMLGIVMVITAWNLATWKFEEWQERRYEEEQYERILWKDTHYEQMDQLYERGDVQAVLDYLDEIESAVYSVYDWEHCVVLEGYEMCENIRDAREEYQKNGYPYLMESAFVDAFRFAVYETEALQARIEVESDRELLEAYIAEAMQFLTEDFEMTDADIAALLTEVEKEGYASYSLLRDYAKGRLEGGN